MADFPGQERRRYGDAPDMTAANRLILQALREGAQFACQFIRPDIEPGILAKTGKRSCGWRPSNMGPEQGQL